MQLWPVRHVMRTDVPAVRDDALLGDIIGMLEGRRVEIVPVVDKAGRVVGVICPGDLRRREAARRPDAAARSRVGGDLVRVDEVMTVPAWTIDADAPLTAAAQRMYLRKVERLPVTADGGRLVGVVSATDLLRVFGRPDTAIRQDVIDQVLRRTMHVDPTRVHVAVDNGTVTLVGTVERRTAAAAIARLAHTVPGVVAVVDRLSYEYDDTPFTEPDDASFEEAEAVTASWWDWPTAPSTARRPTADGDEHAPRQRPPTSPQAWWADPPWPESLRPPVGAGTGR